ncbi:elongin A, like isoform X2 [Periophthalmus magnuspinnatus]|uniref:elongin A, like isoform X2 n=1 Tax=Periophthalmus magnuspinnatus TaxID=409849 RepID=UPI002436FE59|nr:elongin A, like isoform X2 [Periophthalmus magnuspinnatus]
MACTSDVVNKIIRYKLQLTNTDEAAKILKTLKKLKDLEVTLDVLAETGIGKTVNSLRRHELAGDLAKSIVKDWKKLVPKGSKSPSIDDKTTGELQCTDKSDKAKAARDDFNNNYLPDEREEDEPVNKKIKRNHLDTSKDYRDANEQKKQRTSANEFLNKTKLTEKQKKKNTSDESSDETPLKSSPSENILGKEKSKSHKRKKYSRFSDNESDPSESGSDKEPLNETKSTDQTKSICPEPSRTKPKVEQFKVRHSDVQKRKRKKHDKHKRKETSPVIKAKNPKRNKNATSDAEEPTMSFESYLNYDENVSKKKERPKPKKHPHKSTPVFKKEPEKAVNVQPEEPMKELTMSSLVPVCPDSPIQISSESIMRIPESPPLESWFPEVETKRKEKEDDSCDILEESAIFTGQRLNKKMQVYSGAKTIFLPAMMSLYQQCIRTLQNNINLLYETGGVPFEILEPVLERCTPEQLLRIEEFNPIYIGETDHLWGKHCQRDFKDAKLLEYESWKEMYLRLSEERERKFKMLTKTISSAQSTRPKGRQVKMAFIHSVAKPPRDVRIKQEIHGTAVQQPLPKCSMKVTDGRPRHTPKETTRPSSSTSATTNSQDPRKKTSRFKVAPMMAKSLKAFKKQFSRR